MKRVVSLLAIVMMVAFYACESGGDGKSSKIKVDNPNLREVVVKEVIHTTSYTYLNLKEEGAVYWAAIPRQDDIVEGNTYYYDNFMEMKNFPSKELDRTFDNIYFIQTISDKPFPAVMPLTQDQKGSPKAVDMEVENIQPAEGGTTIAELFNDKAAFAGKAVKIKGQVVKYTAAVMGKNWVHIQDGTNSGGNIDITITTTDVVKVGDVASFEGMVVLDKDFGYGYAYDILIEDAKLIEVDESRPM